MVRGTKVQGTGFGVQGRRYKIQGTGYSKNINFTIMIARSAIIIAQKKIRAIIIAQKKIRAIIVAVIIPYLQSAGCVPSLARDTIKDNKKAQ